MFSRTLNYCFFGPFPDSKIFPTISREVSLEREIRKTLKAIIFFYARWRLTACAIRFHKIAWKAWNPFLGHLGSVLVRDCICGCTLCGAWKYVYRRIFSSEKTRIWRHSGPRQQDVPASSTVALATKNDLDALWETLAERNSRNKSFSRRQRSILTPRPTSRFFPRGGFRVGSGDPRAVQLFAITIILQKLTRLFISNVSPPTIRRLIW